MATQTMRAMKIMQKPYHLVHDGIKEGEAITVSPPRLPGLNKDFMNPKNDKGEWVRVFTVTEGNASMRKGKELTLTHLPGEVPSCEIDGVKWYIQPIPGIAAVKKRGPERKGFKGTMVADTAAPTGEQSEKRGRGRPKGSKNKPKQNITGVIPLNVTPKRRGRPPGSKNKVQNGEQKAEPKRRGRPPGSKNKPAGDLNQELLARIKALEAKIGATAPKRRGRPPGSKNKEKSAHGNGRRGRPKGSKNKATITYEKRLKALEKARAARKAKLAAGNGASTAAAPVAAKEPEVIQNV